MTERTDIAVDWAESPRIIEVASPSANIAIQDLHDTLRADTGVDFAESDLDNLDEPYLIDSAGKEDLGGGTKVGITSTLQNGQVAFESRLTPTSTGSVTTSNSAGTVLIDNTATFITDGVERGAVVINFSDQSITEVLAVTAETQLRTRVLRAGTLNEYTSGDAYKIWNVQQCEITGGNLVAIDQAEQALSPVFPTAFTQVVRTSSSSATLQELTEIQYASFAGAVHVNPASSYSGTSYPNGTPRQPVNNLVDALAIASERGIETFHLEGSITIPTGPDFSGYTFEGSSANKCSITIPDAATVDDCEYHEATINGVLDGQAFVERCVVGTVTYINGIVYNSGLSGTVTLGGNALGAFIDCVSLVAGGGPSQTPTIDMGGSGNSLVLRNYHGGIKITNKTGSDPVSMDLMGGQVLIDDTVTTGDLTLRGVGKWTNEDTYAGGASVMNELVDGRHVNETWTILGLDKNNPLVVTKTSQAAGDISQVITGDGETISTVTRQP